MTLVSFIVCLALAWAWFSATGTALVWGATIYQLGMWSVGAVASAYAIRAARAGDPSPLNAACVLWALILWGWLIGWNYGPPGALHAAAHLALAIWFMSRPANWQVVLGVLMLVCAIADAANLIGAFPPRPRVFTGFYYPDVLAFMTHAAFVLIGAASNDGATTRGRSLGHWLRRSVDRHAYRMAVSSKDRKSD